MAQVADLRARGLSAPEIALRLAVSTSTVREDARRLLELRAEDARSALERHLENLTELQRRLHRELDALVIEETDEGELRVREQSERARLFAEIRQVEMAMARLDGSLKERIVHSGDVSFTLDIPKLGK